MKTDVFKILGLPLSLQQNKLLRSRRGSSSQRNSAGGGGEQSKAKAQGGDSPSLKEGTGNWELQIERRQELLPQGRGHRAHYYKGYAVTSRDLYAKLGRF